MTKSEVEKLDLGNVTKEGIYVQTLGPSYQSLAEARMLEAMGGDAVGKMLLSKKLFRT